MKKIQTRKRHNGRILVDLDSRAGFFRDAAGGAAEWARENSTSVFLLHHNYDKYLDQLPLLAPAGVICGRPDITLHAAIIEKGIPVVFLSPFSKPQIKTPAVTVDIAAAAEKALTHLKQRGFTRFGWYGTPDSSTLQHLRNVSSEEIILLYKSGMRGWITEVKHLRGRLSKATEPFGIITETDDHGRHVLEVARQAGLEVPHDLAVVGLGNDRLICEISTPRLSSVDLRGHAAGYTAAKLLTANSQDNRIIALPPGEVEIRESSDTIMVRDPLLAKALRNIQQKNTYLGAINELARQAGAARRTLERRCRTQFKHGPAEIVRAEILTKAKQLLTTGRLPMKRIAFECGFKSASHFAAFVRRETGMTPSEYRAQNG